MKPVVLIPGIGGSILVNKNAPTRKVLGRDVLHNRWLNIYPYIPKSIEHWKYDMGCEVIRNREGGNIMGVKPLNSDIDVYDIGGTKGMKDVLPEFLLLPQVGQNVMQGLFQFRYFHDVCEVLYEAGYRDHQNLFGIPYDFRLILDPTYRIGLFQKFKEYIETPGVPVVVFAHSLGAVLLKWFLSSHVTREWMNAHIYEIILISPPFGGSAASMKTVMFGDFYVQAFHKLYKDELQVNTGVVMCLPNVNGGWGSDVPIVSVGDEDGIRIGDYERLAGLGHVSFEIWRDLYRPHMDVIRAPVYVPTTVFNAEGRDTALWYRTRSIDEYPHEEVCGRGDGIIQPLGREWYANVFRGRLNDIRIHGAKHTDIIANTIVMQKLLETCFR